MDFGELYVETIPGNVTEAVVVGKYDAPETFGETSHELHAVLFDLLIRHEPCFNLRLNRFVLKSTTRAAHSVGPVIRPFVTEIVAD